MNAVEIEEAVSELAEQPFDATEFPFAFLVAFGNRDAVIRRLRSGNNNASDLPGGVLQRQNIHLATCAAGQVAETLRALRESPKTEASKARFILATDGADFQAEDLTTGETVACDYAKFPDHFGFFLPLAGITTVKQIRENAFDIRATSRLNRLYVQLLRDNPEWGEAERRPDMNHFMARLIFCFFAEDTGIFSGEGLFTRTVEQMSDRDASNMHEVISSIFKAMNTPVKHDGNPDDRYRKAAGTPRWADTFPYVNGGLFAGDVTVPQFSRIARSYFLHIGGLDWTQINPDIFGSMIQAVADDEERGELGMHYTSVPNILKVLNPLFLDDLRAQLDAAGDNARALLNLRKRMSRIRVFDPACGSGNFLVIAYKQMRAIEAEINRLRGEADRRSEIPLTNFRGIELRDFAAEIARLALIIAEYQADVQYRGQREALAEFLPLDAENWITCGNALRLDWLGICPPAETGVRITSADLFRKPANQAETAFRNIGDETYLCGNPPYLGGKGQSGTQKEEMAAVFGSQQKAGELDYVAAWLLLAARFIAGGSSGAALVVTNSVNQGAQVHQLWPRIYSLDVEIGFAHKSFRWSNNAANNAAVICSVIGMRRRGSSQKVLYEDGLARAVGIIGPYLVPESEVIVSQALSPLSDLSPIVTGNSAYDGGNLILSSGDKRILVTRHPEAARLVRRLVGSKELMAGEQRYCLWIKTETDAELALTIPDIVERVDRVREFRLCGGDVARGIASRPHQFRYTHEAKSHVLVIPRVSSERRTYIPFGFLPHTYVVSDSAQAVYDSPLFVFSLISSLMHMAWVRAIAGRLKTDLRYASALCYNTYPIPKLTEQNKADLTRCGEDILLAREAHWPATIAELYDPDEMPDDLRAAHDRNDETLERIYIGRRFRNDTERLEKLFELYSKMTAAEATPRGRA